MATYGKALKAWADEQAEDIARFGQPRITMDKDQRIMALGPSNIYELARFAELISAERREANGG